METPGDITQLLFAYRNGESEALDRMLPLVYDQLKRLAHNRLRGERADHTLNTTALVHEAYFKLVDINRVQWNDRAHFLAMAARQMRRILVDYAIKRKAQKRGGDLQKESLDEDRLIPDGHVNQLLELDDALKRLAMTHSRQSEAMELHYFGGLTLEETGEVLGVSPPTVMRDLRFAEAWLARVWHGDLAGGDE